MIRAAREAIAGRVPVLTGVAECTTAMACRFAADAQKAGVDGLMVLPAMVYKADGREAMAHFRAVAKATDLPIMVYNNPVSYGVDITAADVRRAGRRAEVRRHQGIVRKRPPHHRPQQRLRRSLPALRAAWMTWSWKASMLGAIGWVSGLVNAFPAENRLLWDLATAGSTRRRSRSIAGTRRCCTSTRT